MKVIDACVHDKHFFFHEYTTEYCTYLVSCQDPERTSMSAQGLGTVWDFYLLYFVENKTVHSREWFFLICTHTQKCTLYIQGGKSITVENS